MSKAVELSTTQKKKCDRLLEAAKNKTIIISYLPIFIIALCQWAHIQSTKITCAFIKCVADRYSKCDSKIKGNPPKTYEELVEKIGM